MASNSTDPLIKEDDDYQVQYEDEEDDERTIEEEEQLGSDDEDDELDDLEAGANMPLEELLKLYGQNAPPVNNKPQADDDESSTSDDDDDDVENKIDRRPRFHHLLHDNGQLLPEDDDNDSDDSFEPEIIKSINVGDEYQAQVESEAEFDSIYGHSDDREVPNDELLWLPCSMDSIDEYLKTIRSEYSFADDEIALKILLNCQMNIELALVKFRQLPVKTVYSYPEWSVKEIEQFEEGLREYGRNFFKISVFKCPNRTVQEIIHYYYQWKKTERYQVYIEEEQRLNAITSVTDMIEKLIEEQEQQLCTAVNVINSTNSSSILSNDLKINSSISFVTTKRSFDQIDNDSESSSSSSKKPSLNTATSSTTTIV